MPEIPILTDLSLSNLRMQLHLLEGIKENSTSFTPTPKDFLQSFLDDCHVESRRETVEFATSISGLWSVISQRTSALDVIELNIGLERRKLMLANAFAWFWLTQECAPKIESLLMQLTSKSDLEGSLDGTDTWLRDLVKDAYKHASQRGGWSMFYC